MEETTENTTEKLTEEPTEELSDEPSVEPYEGSTSLEEKDIPTNTTELESEEDKILD